MTRDDGPPFGLAHWYDVVGNNWPDISPGDWRGAATAFGSAARAIDPAAGPAAAARVARAVRSSARLQQPLAAMAALASEPETLVRALGIAAQAFSAVAGQVANLRRQLESIAEDAEAALDSDMVNDKGRRQQSILNGYRAEADSAAARAESAIASLPEFPELAQLLGIPLPPVLANLAPGAGPGGSGAPVSLPHPEGAGHPLGPVPRAPFRNGIPLGGNPIPDIPVIGPRPHGPLVGGSAAPVRGPSLPPAAAGEVAPAVLGAGDAVLPAAQQAVAAAAAPAPGGGPPPGTAAPGPAVGSDEPAGSATAPPEFGGSADRPGGGGAVFGASGRGSGASGFGESGDLVPVPVLVPVAVPPEEAPVPGEWTDPAGVGGPEAPDEQPPDVVAPPPESADPVRSSRIPLVSVPDTGVAGPLGAAPPGVSARTGFAASQTGPAAHPNTLTEIVALGVAAAEPPSYVVGETVDEDAILARAVLSGLLGVVEGGAGGSSVVGVGWGVGVFRGVSGVGVFVCSNEGRGWLPAGVFLPVGVSVPWVWGVVGGVGLGWEGCGDAVRVLVEFGRVWGPVAGARLTALVSSGGVDVGLVGEGVSVEGFVGAGSGVGVGGSVVGVGVSGVGGVGLVDRLGLVGGDVGWVDGVGEGELVSRCVGLGWDAHVRVGGLGVGEALGVRGVRERVLGVLRVGGVVGDGLWDELRDGDVLLGVLVGSLRVDVSGVGVGELRFDEVGSRRLRGLVFERRCNELVLLLRGGCSRQVLRDVVYAYGQVVDHPLFDTDLAAAVPGIGNARQ